MPDSMSENMSTKNVTWWGSLEASNLFRLSKIDLRQSRYVSTCFYKQTTLRTEAFTHSSFYAQIFLHREVCAQRRMYTDAFTHRGFYAKKVCEHE